VIHVLAAVLSVFGAAGQGVFAATGLAVFSGAAAFAVLAFAAIHGGLIAFRMFSATGHRLAVFALAAGLA
jgi:hypothetical protein